LALTERHTGRCTRNSRPNSSARGPAHQRRVQLRRQLDALRLTARPHLLGFSLASPVPGTDRWWVHPIIGGIVSIILRRLLRYTSHLSTCLLYLGLGTPDLATALYMAFPVSTAASLAGAQAATFRAHWEVARKSGQRQVGLPSMLDETPPIPGRWYLQTRVFSRVPPVCAALCVSPVRDDQRRLQAIYPSSCARL
jgi:hypothetical protein